MKLVNHIVGVCLVISCSPNQQAKEELKELPFEVTGKAEAMPAFQRGLLLLHNFEYDDAAEAFLEAQHIDPDFAMAYWGEAMTYNHPVWSDLDIDKARHALNKLGKTPEERAGRAKTKLEGDFISSIEILYGGKTKEDRDKEYSSYLGNMYKTYEGNNEVAAFYALSLLGIKNGWSQMEDLNISAAKIAQDILKENPSHPGALHYMVHSDDHPEYAGQALQAARDYAKVASYAGHALHMPSHIYLALGMWDDVVKSNEISWQADMDRKVRKSLTNDDLGYHSHWWLLYGYLQQGRFQKAEQLLSNQQAFTRELPSTSARYHLMMMKGHYLVESGNWESDFAKTEIETSDLALDIRSVDRFIDGSKAFHEKDAKALEVIVNKMNDDLSNARLLRQSSDNIVVCGVTAFVDKIPSAYQITTAEMLSQELMGMAAWLRNDLNGADAYFARAVALSSGYLIGPPKILKPAQELYGEFLLATNNPDRAYEQFVLASKVAPNRVLTLQGQISALNKMGKQEQAKGLETKLNDALKQKDGGNKSI